MNKKANIRFKKWEQGVFALATLWLVGRTLQKYLFWTSTGAFVTSGSWKEYFTYNTFDKTIFVIQLVALSVILINIIMNRKKSTH